MPDVIGAVSGVIELARKAMKAAEAIKNSELKLQMANLISELADVKVKCSELVMENADLKMQLEQSRAIQEAKPVRKDGSYFFNDEGPCCTGCWDSNQKRVFLAEGSKDLKAIAGYRFQCPVCKAYYA